MPSVFLKGSGISHDQWAVEDTLRDLQDLWDSGPRGQRMISDLREIALHGSKNPGSFPDNIHPDDIKKLRELGYLNPSSDSIIRTVGAVVVAATEGEGLDLKFTGQPYPDRKIIPETQLDDLRNILGTLGQEPGGPKK